MTVAERLKKGIDKETKVSVSLLIKMLFSSQQTDLMLSVYDHRRQYMYLRTAYII